MEFSIIAMDNKARAGILKTAHSEIPTPIFMPVGTQGSVKALDTDDLINILDAKIVLANTYHLYLRPGDEVIAKMGGLHGFSKFNRSFLTDSGGFQAFSLSDISKVCEEGIEFKSHIDGSKHFFTPKKVLDIQYNLNSDIMMVLDELIALPANNEALKKSVIRTTKWAKEALEYHKSKKEMGVATTNNLFAIIQGGTSYEFRKMSAESLIKLDFDGFAIGGLSVGESPEEMYETVEFTTPFMPENKPRYLMGVGTPKDIIEGIERGIDMFDCVMPTRNARNGTLFTSFGKINIKSSRYKDDDTPIDSRCDCYTCKRYSKAYISHLYRAGEISYFRLSTLHNLHFYVSLVKKAREAIINKTWKEFKESLEWYK